MKKSLSLILAIAMVFSMFASVAFAGEAATVPADAGKYLQELKVIEGGDGGDLMEGANWKRQDVAVLLSRLLGVEAAAKATAKSHTFADVTNSFYDGYLSWAKANKYMEGNSDTSFGFGDEITNQQFAAVVLRALGVDTTGANYAKTGDLALEKGIVPAGTDFAAKAKRGDTYKAIVAALSVEVGTTGKTLGATLGLKGFEVVVPEIKGVVAKTAKTLEVSFNTAVDSSKVQFKVTRNGADVALTATFSEDGKTATLASTTNLATGTYTVTASGVTFAAGKDVGTAVVEAEKVTKIEVLSEKLVKTDADTATVSYKVYNQYNEDVTKQPIARDLQWTASAGTATDANAGVVTHERGANYTANEVIVLSAVNAATGTSISKVLTVTDVAQVKDITFGEVKLAADVKRLVTGSANAATIPVTAVDQYGNTLDTAATINAGVNFLTSDSNVTVNLADNADGKAELTVNTASLTSAKSVSIIAVIKAEGVTKTKVIEIVKPAAAAEITVTAPTAVVANGDAAGALVAPLAAKDQFNVDLTAKEIADQAASFTITSSNAAVIPSANLGIATSGDNKGKLVNTGAILGEGTSTITVTVNATGKSSSFILEAKAARVLASVSFHKDVATKFIAGSTATTKLVYKDQYGKDFDATANIANKEVVISVTKVSGDDAGFTTNKTGSNADESTLDTDNAITLTAVAGKKGTYTVKAQWRHDTTHEVYSEVSVNVTVVENSSAGVTYTVNDILALYENGADFDAGDVADPTSTTTIGTGDLAAGYVKEVKVTAKDASGNALVIPTSAIVSVSVDSAVAIVQQVSGKWYIAGQSVTEDKKVNLTVVLNTNEGVQQIVKEVTVSNAALAPASIKFLNKAITASDAEEVKSLTFANTAALATGSDVYKYLIDQFGGHSLTFAGTEYLVGMSGITLSDNENITITGNKLRITAGDNPGTGSTIGAGAKVRYLVVTSNGKVGSIDVTVTN